LVLRSNLGAASSPPRILIYVRLAHHRRGRERHHATGVRRAGGVATGNPVAITIIRHARVREEAGALANVEEIAVNPADLPRFPQRGDWVTAWGSQFVVATTRQPDPYGLVELALVLRAG
jgi:hypothetical protein